jgi:hypothetical protein
MRWMLLAALPGLLGAEGMPPRAAATEYPAHAPAGAFTWGAEYLGHSVPAPGGMLFAGNHIVVEVAVFGPGGKRAPIQAGQFSLRWNGRKLPLTPDPPGMVALAMKYSDWNGRQFTMAGGVNDANVILGAPTRRLPDDVERGRRPPGPARVPVPQPEDRSGQTPQQPISLEEVIQGVALPEGDRLTPVAGVLFFPYEGKLTKIKTLDLVWEFGAGRHTLKLASTLGSREFGRNQFSLFQLRHTRHRHLGFSKSRAAPRKRPTAAVQFGRSATAIRWLHWVRIVGVWRMEAAHYASALPSLRGRYRLR